MGTKFTDIVVGDDANAATFNAPMEELGQAIAALEGGADLPDVRLLEWALAGAWRFDGAPAYDATYTNVLESGDILWPDDSEGAYTVNTIDATWEEPSEYTLTHDDSGKTVTATGLVRNASGQVTTPFTFTVS